MIFAEFVVGTVGSLALGVLALTWSGVMGLVLGVWLLGLAANYLLLTAQVISLWHPGALEAELAGADLGAELRRYTRMQIWVLVPFCIAGLALAEARRGT